MCFYKVRDATKASHGNSQINPVTAFPKYEFYKKAVGVISRVCGGPGKEEAGGGIRVEEGRLDMRGIR